MAHIILKRGGGCRDALRGYRVLIDGAPVETLRPRAAAHVVVSDGPHRVRLSIDGMGSPELLVLACEGCPVVLRCAPGLADARAIYKGDASRQDYIALKLDNGDAAARAYLRLALQAARYAAEHRGVGARSRFGMTLGTMSVLELACNKPNAQVILSEGSAHDILWRYLETIGWAEAVDAPSQPAGLPISIRHSRPTDYGRVELLDIFPGQLNLTPRPGRAPPRPRR